MASVSTAFRYALHSTKIATQHVNMSPKIQILVAFSAQHFNAYMCIDSVWKRGTAMVNHRVAS